MKKLKNILSTTLFLVTFVLLVFIVFTRVQGKTPELFGCQILRISSSSMSPELEVGDIILSKRVSDISSIKNGDIITYNGEFGSYADKLITHQVVAEPYESNGVYYLQTKGIANNYADPEICEDQIVGKMVSTLPVLSFVYNFFMTPWGLILVLGFLALLFVNELITLKSLMKADNSSEVNEE